MYFELYLPYFKQGDDLNFFLNKAPSNYDALMSHSQMLSAIARDLERLAPLLKDYEINADTHHIGFEAPDNFLETINLDSLETVTIEKYPPEDEKNWASDEEWDEDTLELDVSNNTLT
jgi:hypothetical protein